MQAHPLEQVAFDQNVDERTAGSLQYQSARNAPILARHEFFRGLPTQIVQRFASRARPVHYRAGQTIFTKGDPGHGLFAVLSGVVRISVVSEDGKEIAFNLLGTDEIFGEIALLDG